MRKNCILIAIVGLLFLVFPLMANAEIVNSGTCGENITWELDNAGNLSINGTGEMYDSDSDESLFPASDVKKVVIGNGVTSVGERAFYGCSELISVTFPNSLSQIKYRAFYGCTKLVRVIIPSNVKTVGNRAFQCCSNLTTVTLQNGVEKIDNRAFGACSNLSSISLPGSLKIIDYGAFWDCTSLTNVSIPNSVTSIGDYSFNNCSSLTTISIPSSVNNIGEHAFADCAGLTDLYCSASVIGKYAFQNCNLSNITLSSDVQRIEYGAFTYCKVQTLVIPEGVTSIDGYAFGESNITTLVFPKSLISIGDDLCRNYSSYKYVTIKADCDSYAYEWAQHATFQIYNSGMGYWKDRRYSFISTNHKEKTVIKRTPTCKATGIKDTICEICGAEIAINEEIPIVDHDPASDQNGFDPTCIETGLTDSTSCIYCGMEMSSQEIIPALGHDWDAPSFSWSDDNSEVTAFHTCKRDETHTETETAAASYEKTKEPSCTEPGETTYSASFTNKTFGAAQKTVPNIPAHGHDWDSPDYSWAQDNSRVTAVHYCIYDHSHLELETAAATSTTTATCDDPGDTTYTSASFNNPSFSVQSKTITGTPALGHDWDQPQYTWSDDNRIVIAVRTCKRNRSHSENEMVESTSELTKAATCAEMGETTYTSAAFENEAFEVQTKTVANIQILGHDWGEASYTWSDDNNTVTGIRICSRNKKHIDTETVSVNREVVKSPSCLTMGIAKYTSVAFNNEAFEVQSKTLTDIPALGHDLEHCPSKDPTCLAVGWYAYDICKREGCDYSTYAERPALGHNLLHHNGQAPTCTDYGWDSYDTCTRNGCNYSTYVKKEALGHDIEHHNAQAPTCTAVGWNAYDNCKRPGCTYTTYNERAKLGHNTVYHSPKAPTCTAVGWYGYYTCSRPGCNYSTYSERPALGHNLLHHDGRAPTCTVYGWDDYDTCTRSGCNYTTYVKKEALGHDILHHDAQAPTCTDAGWNAYDTCRRDCGYSTTYTVIPATGHAWNETEYIWSEDNTSVTATHKCLNDESHTETEKVEVISEIYAPTENQEGIATYTSKKFAVSSFTQQTKTQSIPSLQEMTVLHLPDMLGKVEDEAFENLACEAVIVPEECTTIGSHAFRNCRNLKYIRISQEIEIAEDAFEGCKDVIVDRSNPPLSDLERIIDINNFATITMPGRFYQRDIQGKESYHDDVTGLEVTIGSLPYYTYDSLKSALKKAYGSISEISLNGIKMIGIAQVSSSYTISGVAFIAGNQAYMVTFMFIDNAGGNLSAEIMNSIKMKDSGSTLTPLPVIEGGCTLVHDLYGKTLSEANQLLTDKLNLYDDGLYYNAYLGVMLDGNSRINWIAVIDNTKYSLFGVKTGMGWIQAQATLGGYGDWGWTPINNSPNDYLFVCKKYADRKVMFTKNSKGKVQNVAYGQLE